VTAHPIPENHGQWWLVTGDWRRLHAIPGESLTVEEMRTSIDTAEPLRLRAVCGQRGWWTLPGVGSRLGLQRCHRCCDGLGITRGCGTPANETEADQ
jgi:hypothetical protein